MQVSAVDFDGDSSSIGEMKVRCSSYLDITKMVDPEKYRFSHDLCQVLQGMCLLCLLFLLSAMAVDIGPYAATTPAALKRQHAKRKLV